ALDVAAVGDGDHHLLVRDQILERERARVTQDLRAPVVTVLVGDLLQLVLDDLVAATLVPEDVAQVGDRGPDLRQLRLQLLDLQPGQLRQTHVQDRIRLTLRQLEPATQPLPRFVRRLRPTDDLDHLVDVVDGDLQTLEDVLPLQRLAELELGTPAHHFVSVLHEVVEHLLQAQHPGDAVHQRQHDDAEGALHLRVLIELVQDDVGNRIPLQLHDDAHPLPVALVAKVRDSLDLPLAHQLGNLLDQPRLVHHEGDLADDDALAAPPVALFDLRPRAHDHA